VCVINKLKNYSEEVVMFEPTDSLFGLQHTENSNIVNIIIQNN